MRERRLRHGLHSCAGSQHPGQRLEPPQPRQLLRHPRQLPAAGHQPRPAGPGDRLHRRAGTSGSRPGASPSTRRRSATPGRAWAASSARSTPRPRPVVKNAALNVPGGDPELILLTSPAFAAAEGRLPGRPGRAGRADRLAAVRHFLIIAKWIIDPADPLNAGAVPGPRHRLRPAASCPTAAHAAGRYIQWIQNDQVVPNPSTRGAHPARCSATPTATGCWSIPPTRAVRELLGEAVRQQREPGQQPRLPARLGRGSTRSSGAG